jgi:hypothetical protein
MNSDLATALSAFSMLLPALLLLVAAHAAQATKKRNPLQLVAALVAQATRKKNLQHAAAHVAPAISNL